MSHEASAWVWENSQTKGVGRFILLAIADKAPASTCQAYASLSWLEGMANAGRPAVVEALKNVLGSGELEVVEGETGPFGAKVYRLPKALGYIPGSAKSVRSQNRSKAAVSGGKTMRDQSNSSLSEPIEGAESASGAIGDGEIGSVSEPGGSVSEPIEGSCLSEPIDEIGSVTELGDIEPDGQSVLFGGPIGSVRQPLHKNTTTNTSNKDQRASVGAKKPGRKDADEREEPLDPDAFAAFWKAYPKKVSKPQAVTAWNKALNRNAEPSAIIAGAAAYKTWPSRDPGFTANAATWLNNDRWEDEYEPPRPPQQQTYRGPAYGFPPIDPDDNFDGDI